MNYKIGFIGYGKMANAISKYLISSGFKHIYVSDPYIDSGSSENIITCANNAELVNSSDIVFLAIKPQNAKDALNGLNFSGKILVSIMAGITISRIRDFGKNINKIVRVMPNLCARVGKSVNAYTAEGLSDSELKTVKILLKSFGTDYEINENEFDTITGLTGSGPAYVFRYIKNVIECGCEDGIDFEKSKDLVLDMLEGCVSFLRDSKNIDQIQMLIENVCSKGGTTIEGIYKLDEGHFDELVKSATKSAIKKSKELSRQ